MTTTLLLAAALALSPEARAAFSGADAGTAAGQFLKLGADARSAGMGDAVYALSEDANAVYWNPAGLADLRYRHATITHAAYYQNVFYDFLAYAQPLQSVLGGRRERELRENQLGSIGVGVLYLNAGQLAEIDNTGTPTGGSFTPQDAAFIAGWGASLTRNLDVGLAGKYVASRIQDSASTGAFDIGARLHLDVFTVPYVLAAGVSNLGGRLKYVSESDPLPTTMRIGNALRPTRNWVVTCDLVAPRDGAPYPAFGSEFRFPFDPQMAAILRVGYQRRTSASDLQGLTGLTVGAGLGFSRLGVDYAWAPFGLLGDTHRFSLSYRF